jgi:O-antigen/teichoic acid export membrane protein
MTSARRVLGRVVPRGGLASAVTVLMAGSVVGQLALVASMPLLSRLYDPGDLGLFAVFSSVESILVVAAALRYDYAVGTAEDEDDAANLLGLALLLGLAVSVAVVAGALLLAGPLELLNLGSLRPYVVLLGVSLAGDAAYQALSLWAIRSKEYRAVSRTKAVQGGAQAMTQVGLGVAGLAPAGLLFGWTAGRMAGSYRLGRLVHAGGGFARMSWRGMRDVARRFWRFPTLAAPAALLNGASLQLPGILLAVAYDARVAGWFLLASRCTSIPVTVLGQSLSQAIMGRLSPAAVNGAASPSPRIVRRVVTRLLMVAAVPALAIVVAAPSAFTFIFGGSWDEAGRYAQLLAPAALLQFAVSPLAWVLTLHGRQAQQLMWDSARLALVLGALLVPSALGAGAHVAVGSFSAVLVVTYLVLLVMILRAEEGAPAPPPLVTPVASLAGTA